MPRRTIATQFHTGQRPGQKPKFSGFEYWRFVPLPSRRAKHAGGTASPPARAQRASPRTPVLADGSVRAPSTFQQCRTGSESICTGSRNDRTSPDAQNRFLSDVSNRLFNFTSSHYATLINYDSSILLVVHLVTAHFDAPRAATLLPHCCSVGFSFLNVKFKTPQFIHLSWFGITSLPCAKIA